MNPKKTKNEKMLMSVKTKRHSQQKKKEEK
jgi:hypothetical protein